MKAESLRGRYKENDFLLAVACCWHRCLLFVCLLLALLFAVCGLLVAVVCSVLLCCCLVKTELPHGEYKTSNVIVG